MTGPLRVGLRALGGWLGRPGAMTGATGILAVVAFASIAAGGAPEVTEHLVKADGVSLRVRDMGTGDAVVLLAGGPGFAGEQMYSSANVVAKTHRAILPDQRGTGASAIESTDGITLDTAVADLEAVRSALELERWTVVGHSWGAVVAMAYAGAHPDRVAGLVLVSPAGPDATFWGRYQQNMFAKMNEQTRAALGAIDQTGTPADVVRASNKAMAPLMVADSSSVPALHEEMTPERFNPDLLLALQPVLLSYDVKGGLGTLEAPVRILQGDQDPIGLETTQEILDLIPGSTRTLIDDCGHWPFIERPEAYGNALAEAIGPPR